MMNLTERGPLCGCKLAGLPTPDHRQREASEEPTTTGKKTPTEESQPRFWGKCNFPPVATKLSFELSGVSQSKIRLGINTIGTFRRLGKPIERINLVPK